MIKMAVLGFGTVGSGVVELIDRNQDVIRKTVPEGIYVKYILDLREFPGSPYEDRVTHDYKEILDDGEISVICETMGGRKPAYDFTKAALERGISVCTSNKELVAAHGPELLKIAAANRCSDPPDQRVPHTGEHNCCFRHSERNDQLYPHPHGKSRSQL